MIDASGGQLSSASTVDDVDRLDFAEANPVTGPVLIDGAAPGDVLKLTLLSFVPSGWGWTANIPGFGLLAQASTSPRCTCGSTKRRPSRPPCSAAGAGCR